MILSNFELPLRKFSNNMAYVQREPYLVQANDANDKEIRQRPSIRGHRSRSDGVGGWVAQRSTDWASGRAEAPGKIIILRNRRIIGGLLSSNIFHDVKFFPLTNWYNFANHFLEASRARHQFWIHSKSLPINERRCWRMRAFTLSLSLHHFPTTFSPPTTIVVVFCDFFAQAGIPTGAHINPPRSLLSLLAIFRYEIPTILATLTSERVEDKIGRILPTSQYRGELTTSLVR